MIEHVKAHLDVCLLSVLKARTEEEVAFGGLKVASF
jgi:hypothetical protein